MFATNAFDAETVEFDVDFENLGILGSGAFSKVFKCRSVHDKQLYAIKKSKRQLGVNAIARYLEEVQTFQLLGPNCPMSFITTVPGKRMAFSIYKVNFAREAT